MDGSRKIAMRRSQAAKLHARWIPYFDEVVRVGSIRGAAKVLNVAPSVISRQIKDIEGIIGDQLLERVAKRLVPTPAGEVVADHVSQILRGVANMQGSLDAIRGLQRGHISIAAFASTAIELMPRILVPFVKKHPTITLTCDFIESTVVASQVLAGEVDIGIAFNPPPSPGLRTLISVPVPLGAVLSPTNELARRKSLRLYDLVDSGTPLIFPDKWLHARAAIEEILSQSRLEAYPLIRTSDQNLVLSLAQAGVGVAFQTPIGIERELRDGSLVFVPLSDPGLKPRQLSVIISAVRRPSLIATLLAEAARVGAAELLK